MQVHPEQLKRQQVILKFLGFYREKCDGIWSSKSIAAMQKFERDQRFKPAFPTNGLPLNPSKPLPSGFMRDPANPNLLMYTGLTEAKIAEILNRDVQRPQNQQNNNQQKHNPPAQKQEQKVEPKVEDPVETEVNVSELKIEQEKK